MKLLAFDTSSTTCSVALAIDNEVKSSHHVAPRQQAKLILSDIQALLNEANLELSQLDGIAYACGPGSFTGIRIASCVAQALAFANNFPVIRISSLAAIAQAAYMEKGVEDILVGIDARVGQLYWGKYTIGSEGYAELEGEEQACLPQQVELPIKNASWHSVGDAWVEYQEALAARLGCLPPLLPFETFQTAKAVLALATPVFQRNDGKVSAYEAYPAYLR